MTDATYTATYTHRLAFDGYATVSTLERRSTTPKREVSSITFSSDAAHIIRTNVRSNDLVQVKNNTVTVVVTAGQREAKAIVSRLNTVCALAGYGVPTLLEIKTFSF